MFGPNYVSAPLVLYPLPSEDRVVPFPCTADLEIAIDLDSDASDDSTTLGYRILRQPQGVYFQFNEGYLQFDIVLSQTPGERLVPILSVVYEDTDDVVPNAMTIRNESIVENVIQYEISMRTISKNHMDKRFQLVATLSDIEGRRPDVVVRSTPVLVKSKRTHTKRTRDVPGTRRTSRGPRSSSRTQIKMVALLRRLEYPTLIGYGLDHQLNPDTDRPIMACGICRAREGISHKRGCEIGAILT